MQETNQNKVKCTVCGAILDADVEVCPVCGVGKEYFVPAVNAPAEASIAVARRREDGGRYIIIGAGIAGLCAAQEIRRVLSGASIVMIEQEMTLPYLRPSLSKEVPSTNVGARFQTYPPEWYSKNGIFLYSGREVIRVDTGRKIVVLSDGEELTYDKCIFATGAASRVPPIEGREMEGVFTLRTVEDFRQMGRYIARTPGKDRRAVVVGGGVLGLESAMQLQLSGFAVTILEGGPKLMGARASEKEASEAYRQALSAGFEVYLGVRVNRFEGDGEAVRRVTFTYNDQPVTVDADLVLLSCGNVPRVDLAKAAGLDVDRAILVNSRMMTSKYGVYACGDCAQLGADVCGLWTTAEAMGRCAGRNAAGEDAIFEFPLPPQGKTQRSGLILK